MADNRPVESADHEGAFVTVVGRLGEAPNLEELPGGKGHFCEIVIDGPGYSLPVRFFRDLALEISGHIPNTRVRLQGELHRFEWEVDGETREKWAVVCKEIDKVWTPRNGTPVTSR